MKALTPRSAGPEPGFEVRFPSLCGDGDALAFPCDGEGRVDLDALSESARTSYFYARAMIGRDFARPHVSAVAA